ncbi:MAG TPA: PleD family two-component system response regulator [Xenococcaceae cyanobacterium]
MHSKSPKNRNKSRKANQPSILVVDNDRDNLLLASCIIEALGMQCVVTDDSEECFNLVNQLLPDVILLDIVMPKLNGLEITRKLKQNCHICNIPVIAVTGLTRPQDTSKIIEAGCDDYICKPYLIEELEAKIDRCLKLTLV